MIEPLLQAFEQTKKEKDELLADYKQAFDELANRCKHTVLENDALRHELEETKAKVRLFHKISCTRRSERFTFTILIQ